MIISDTDLDEAAAELVDRDFNLGSWRNGVPASFRRIKENNKINDGGWDDNWVLVVELAVKAEVLRRYVAMKRDKNAK